MLNITKSISVQGTSMIEENGNKVAVMYLSAILQRVVRHL